MASVTLVLSEKEASVLDELCKRKDLNKTALLRQCLRLYQAVDNKLCDGLQMAFVDAAGNVVKTEIIGLGPL